MWSSLLPAFCLIIARSRLYQIKMLAMRRRQALLKRHKCRILQFSLGAMGGRTQSLDLRFKRPST